MGHRIPDSLCSQGDRGPSPYLQIPALGWEDFVQGCVERQEAAVLAPPQVPRGPSVHYQERPRGGSHDLPCVAQGSL